MVANHRSALVVAGVLFLSGLLLPSALSGRTDTSASEDVARPTDALAPSATLTGSVLLPPREREGRRFRGRAYRQRTNRGDREQSAQSTASEESRYRSVVISAHPVSFEASVEPPSEPATVDQQDASFVPQVTPVRAGTTVEFVNSDPFYHNVFSLTRGARFNIGRRPTGVVVEESIPRLDDPAPGLGVVELHCDIHPQMNAFIVSLETPYFTRANDDGTYELETLPEGQYVIRAFAPRESVTSFEVELSEDERLSRPIDLR